MYRFLEYTAQDYMTPSAKTVGPDATMRDLDRLFRTHDFNSFPVVENGKFVGLVTKFDLLKTFAFTPDRMVPPYEQLMARNVGEAMTRNVLHAAPATPLTRVLELMVGHKIRSLPVVDDGGALAGIISREDIIRALDDATKR